MLRNSFGRAAIELIQGKKMVIYSAVPKGVIGHGSMPMIQAGIGTKGRIGFEDMPRYAAIICIGPRTAKQTVDPVNGIVVDTAPPKGRVGEVKEPCWKVVVSMILTVVIPMGQPVVGILGGPANAPRRRLLAPIGELVSEMRQEHTDVATGAGAEIVQTLTLDKVTLAEAA